MKYGKAFYDRLYELEDANGSIGGYDDFSDELRSLRMIEGIVVEKDPERKIDLVYIDVDKLNKLKGRAYSTDVSVAIGKPPVFWRNAMRRGKLSNEDAELLAKYFRVKKEDILKETKK